MKQAYKNIVNVIKADIEKVDKNLEFDICLKRDLAKELIRLLHSKSKRIRSVVTLLYLRASKMYLLPEHYELLAAVEIMHNVSLIHDDVIDESKYRRKYKTLNEKFDNQLAVLCGDYLLSVALKKLVSVGSNKVMDIFADALSNMCCGEIKQQINRNNITDLEEYIEKSFLKTALLFESALKASVILADCCYNTNMSEFITNFGIAFQIRDDLLNVINNDNTDADVGIYNAPYILDKNLEKGIIKTKELLSNYVGCSRHCLQNLEESPYKAALYGILELTENV